MPLEGSLRELPEVGPEGRRGSLLGDARRRLGPVARPGSWSCSSGPGGAPGHHVRRRRVAGGHLAETGAAAEKVAEGDGRGGARAAAAKQQEGAEASQIEGRLGCGQGRARARRRPVKSEFFFLCRSARHPSHRSRQSSGTPQKEVQVGAVEQVLQAALQARLGP